MAIDLKLLEKRIDKWLNEETEKSILEWLLEQRQIANKSDESLPIKCQCKRAKFTRTVDADFNPLCGKCGKAI